MKKLLGTVASLALALALPASTAWAQQYPTSNFVSMDDTTVVINQLVNSSACCFQGPVTWTMRSHPRVVGTSFPDTSGVARLTWRVPADAELGSHTLSASGTDINGIPLTVTTTFTVVRGTGRGGLTPTGSNTIPWLLIGLGSVAVGGTLVTVAKRRGIAA
ncbi:MAG TPA: hypothetical protein VM841_11615 [Actinomycetota bacterium]|nr:hypothetical protein [Actinomycetota bacterium]